MPLVLPMPRLPVGGGPLASRQDRVATLAPPLVTGGERSETRYGIVHMTAGGSLAGTIEHLRLARLSYHYLIDRDGQIVRACDPTRIAFHAGASSWGGTLAGGTSSLNPVSLGVALAHRNDASEPVTEAAYLSLLWLCCILSESYGIFAADWLGHREVSPGRKTDPHPDVFDLASFRCDLVTELHKRRKVGRR